MAKEIIYDKEGKDTGEATTGNPLDKYWTPWALRQAGIGLVDTPGTFGTLYGLGRAGASYLWDRKGGPTDTEGNPVGKPFAEELLDPEGGKEKLQQYDQTVINSLRDSHPNESNEQLQERFDKVRKHSTKYFEETTPFYRSGLAFGRRWGLGTNEFFNDPRLPSERTQGDTLMNIVGGAAPIPGVGGALDAAAQVGAKVVGRTAARVGVGALEAATPLTILPKGATVGEAATRTGLNVAIPEAIDQASRAYSGEPSVAADAVKSVLAKSDTPAPVLGNLRPQVMAEDATKDDGSQDATKLGAFGIIGVALAALRGRNIKVVTPSAGPTTSSMLKAAHPTVGEAKMIAARTGSDVEPFRVMAKAQGLDDEQIEAFMTRMNTTGSSFPIADHANWFNEKVSPVVEEFARKDPQFISKYLQHAADSDRVWGDVESLNRTNNLLTEAQQDLAKATNSGRSTPTRIQELTDKVNKLDAEKNARIADTDPALRYSLMNEDRATVAARLQQSRQDPAIRAFEGKVKPLYHDLFDTAASEGAMSAADAARMKLAVDRGNYHLQDNPLAQKNWLERQAYKLTDRSQAHLLESNPSDAISLYRMANSERVRKGYGNLEGKSEFVNPPADFTPHPRTNNPRNPLTELNHVSVRVRQAIAHNRAKREYTEMMLASKSNSNPSSLAIKEIVPENKIGARIKDIEKSIADSDKGPRYEYAYRGEDGTLIHVVHTEHAIHEALKFAPAAVVPIINGTRKLIQTFVTGWLHPAFAMKVSVPFDILVGGLLRHPAMSYGPISNMAARTFGMGSPMARLISTVGAGVDIPFNLFARYPYTAVKAITSELFLNNLAKKWQADLQANSGIISTIAKTFPGGQQFIGQVANLMAKAYDASWTNLTKTYKVGHTSNFSDEMISRINQIDALVKKRPFLKSTANVYRDLLTVFIDVPKQMALSENIPLFKRELAKGRAMGKQMSEAFIADQSRIIGGDMARTSAIPWIQKAVSVVPWSNPAIQSVRYMVQRMFPGKDAASLSKSAENVGRMLSLSFAATWAYYMVAKDKDTNDWFFNQLPNEKRAQSIPFPDPYRYIMRLAGKDLPRGTPEQEFVLQRMPPEIMLAILPMIHGLRALGIIPNANEVVVPQSLKDDMSHAADQVFGLAIPPIGAGIAGLFGKKIEPMKAFHGENPFRDIRDFNFAGANKDKMSPQSRISHQFYDAVNGMFGTVVASLVEAANYGMIEGEAPNGSWQKGLTKGAQKLALSQSQDFPGTSYLWPEATKRYIYTPIAEKLQHDMAILGPKGVDSQMTTEPGLRRVVTPHAKINTTEKVGAQEGAVVGSTVTDPDLQFLLARNHMVFFEGPYKQLMGQRKLEGAKHQAMTIGADPSQNQTPLMRHIAAQDQAKKVNELDRRLYNIYQDQWKIMKNSPSGIAFEQKYGELTPENLLKAVQQSSSANARQNPR